MGEDQSLQPSMAGPARRLGGGRPPRHWTPCCKPRRLPLRRPVETGQYVSIRYTERLAEAGIEPSVGSVGDSYDNALAETVIGLFKAEVIHRRGPWRSFEAVEYATLEWVDWFMSGCPLARKGVASGSDGGSGAVMSQASWCGHVHAAGQYGD